MSKPTRENKTDRCPAMGEPGICLYFSIVHILRLPLSRHPHIFVLCIVKHQRAVHNKSPLGSQNIQLSFCLFNDLLRGSECQEGIRKCTAVTCYLSDSLLHASNQPSRTCKPLFLWAHRTVYPDEYCNSLHRSKQESSHVR